MSQTKCCELCKMGLNELGHVCSNTSCYCHLAQPQKTTPTKPVGERYCTKECIKGIKDCGQEHLPTPSVPLNEDWEKLRFYECNTCEAKPGSPILCYGCILNRETIEKLKSLLSQERKRVAEELRELLKQYGVNSPHVGSLILNREELINRLSTLE